ncbi:leukocyte elastase inhibitor isoform X2 [Cephus cinctus]|uniref:Leukocyte elastase inhibitor isoform X2 n=2 Tax=Cephus cinctus TaxID=211228 RepID=A0AAJ7BKY3_CEPCN|nr:leukocyte elastase inhibitor isoform X2 [Cephus cinctus]
MNQDLFLVICCLLVNANTEDMAAAPESLAQDAFKNASEACNKFSNTFYKALVTDASGNLASSPLSLHIVLSLLSHGASGMTAEQLKAALHLAGVDHPVHGEISLLLDTLKALSKVELSLANTIFIHNNISLLPEFKLISTNSFKATVPKVDFEDSAGATQQINAWVEENTKNKIKDCISAGSIKDDTKVILVNAIYFKGNWADKFNPDFTTDRPFYVTQNQKKLVPTMFKKTKYPRGKIESLNVEVVEIPYVNTDLDLLIILPNEREGLEYLENNFDWDTIATARRFPNDVEIYLPKFKLEVTSDLEQTLRKIGLHLIFEDLADFSSMTAMPLKVSSVIQKVFVEINEEGSEAAATTVVQMRLRRMINESSEFLVDHPFMFVIRHKPTNIPLFIGRVKDFDVPISRDEL